MELPLVQFSRLSCLRFSVVLKLAFVYLVVVGTLSGNRGLTEAVGFGGDGEGGDGGSSRHGFAGTSGVRPPPAEALRQTLALLSTGGQFDQQMSEGLKTLRDTVYGSGVVNLANEVLASGVLDKGIGGIYSGNNNNDFNEFPGQSDGYGGGLHAVDAGGGGGVGDDDDANNKVNVIAAFVDDGVGASNVTTPASLTNLTTTPAAANGTTAMPANVTTAMPGPPVNHQCMNDTATMLEALAERQPWALQMLDADGKPGPNMEGLQLFWVGDYEECTKVEAIQNGTGKMLFKGRYCTAVIPLTPKQLPLPIMPAVPPSGLRLGLCVPDSCSAPDITMVLNEVMAWRNISFRVGLTTCQEDKVDYDAKAIVVLCICSLFLLIMAVGTAYDVIMLQRPKWQKEAMEMDDDSPPNPSGRGNGYGSVSNDPADAVVNSRGGDAEQQPLLGKGRSGGSGGGGGGEAPAIGALGKVLVAFSVYTNGGKILNATHTPGSITCIHGIRFISMTWVILGHTFAFGLTTAANYYTYLKEATRLWSFQAITGAPVTVDTFFVLSGLLVTYLILKEMDRRNGKMQWFLFYFHRFWRLTPPYAFVMMMYVPLFRYLGNGPNWLQEGTEVNYCKETWWTNLLYINNFVRVKEMCISWSWYLSNDMQFYVISPLIFVPLFRWPKVGLVLASLWLLATATTAGVIASVRKFPPSIGLMDSGMDPTISANYFFDYYIKPYCRFGPYVVGMLTGYALYATKCKVRMNLFVSLSGWAVATGVGLSVVYGLHGAANGHPLSNNTAAFYNAVHHTVWGACVSWVIFACATGHGGPVNALLSWNAFIPLSRLTYMAYLIHPVVMDLYHLGAPSLFYLSHFHCAMAFLAFTVVAFAAAFVLSLAFEAPMMGLEKALLTSKRSKH